MSNSSLNRFPHYTFSGGPIERGHACGEALRERIHATYALYSDSLFSNSAIDAAEMKLRAQALRLRIGDYASVYKDELDALARGAAIDAWQIYVLNSRTEILNAPVSECTALYFKESRVLGQNWDWVGALEDLAVLITWELPEERKILTFTEPGMLGKIGFNNAGLGVCLNILFSEHALDGVPVHVMTRAVLDGDNVAAARDNLIRSGRGKSSHFLLADASGDACSMEFAAGERFEAAPTENTYLHTNHCIAASAQGKSAIIPTSIERFEQACTHLKEAAGQDTTLMKKILLDQSQGNCSINLPYHPEALLDNQPVGTCATIIMDLAQQEMQIKKGPGSVGDFAVYQL